MAPQPQRPSPTLIDKARLNLITQVNLDPINQQALELLPPEWKGNATLHSLALIRWLIDERGIESDFRPGPESVLAMLDKLERDDPRQAFEYLTTSDSGDPMLDNLPEDQDEAALTLLQALVDKMISTAP